MIIVLDTNVFRGDVHARKPWLSAVLDGAMHGEFEVVIPEAVIRELVKQYPKRLAEAVQGTNSALGAATKELRRLEIDPPAPIEVDEAKLAAEYETQLRERLSGDGCRIEADPTDLGAVVAWAVDRRKPFKEDGEGVPDAAIWLTVLELARSGTEVLLVSKDGDFGTGQSPPSLHPEMASDLTERDLPDGRVRLVTDVKLLVDEIVAPMAEAEARAQRLITDPELSGRVRDGIQRALLYAPIPQDDLHLGVDLDNDPQPIALDVADLELISVREVSDGQLSMEIRALADLHLDMAVFKADFAIADDDSPIAISRSDLNDHYFQGEAEIAAWLTLDIYTDLSVEELEVESVEAKRLSDEEVLERRLAAGAAESLMDLIRDPSGGGELYVGDYVPDIPLQSGIDQATVEQLSPTAVQLRSIDDQSSEGVACSLTIDAEGDVTWLVVAPSGFDSDRYPSLSDAEPGEGGFLSDVESNVPLRLLLTGVLAPNGEWQDLEPDEVVLEPTELKRRASRNEEAEEEELNWIEKTKERARERRAEGAPGADTHN